MHPVVVCYKTELGCLKYCIILNSMQHSAAQQPFFNSESERPDNDISMLDRLIYVSDAQCKNFKNLTYLCHYEKDCCKSGIERLCH